MSKDKYVAYVGTYTHGNSLGIHIYDLDVEKGHMTERAVVPVNNASHVAKSNNGRYLYSIADEGVEVLEIDETGGLKEINQVNIDGMRGCFLSTDIAGERLFVAGYHDGKITVVRIHEDGRLGSVMDGIFHKGLGSVAERNFRPHVSCVMPTPDGKYLCVVDNGIDQIKLYTVHPETGKLKLYDVIRCKLESAPRWIRFSRDGCFAYVNCELTNEILVFRYDGSKKTSLFELIQTVSTVHKNDGNCATSGLRISPSGKYLYCSTAGDDSAGVFKIDSETGKLANLFILPISGKYPKDVAVFPDEQTLVVLNHESNDIRFFKIDYEKRIMTQRGKPIKIETPNCILISKVGQPD